MYAGIGGNRKLWGDEHDVVAVENNEEIANAYGEFYPNDTVVVGDAHTFLLITTKTLTLYGLVLHAKHIAKLIGF